ncbi:hypothetical protein [Luteibacter sp. 329MFSha]|uniref:hypothetical protein n=1 Tax=Luteibacter sp. 329MFSha TaxID=1798239 RepID=UPI0008C5CBF4|nr:hypothetical protein [Luteibacter sp. 329MFSha]SEV84461.1 hypothetical protein SAMN04515660_0195 [Luteibacter sp. 329MFSha]
MHRPREKRFDPIGHLIPKPHQTHAPFGHMARESTIGMTSPKPFRHGIAAAILMMALPSAVAQTKVFTPPPLNPHPREALHITVSFDRPEDGDRYSIILSAHYQNQQRECGHVEDNWNRLFIYPEGTFEIQNKSRNPRQAKFDVYLDRYNREQCNWEFTSPQIRVLDTYTGKFQIPDWGGREDLRPGTTYRATCPFRNSEFAQQCFGKRPVPETALYEAVPQSRRIRITVYVREDSAPLRPRSPSHFDNFVSPLPQLDTQTVPPAPGGRD